MVTYKLIVVFLFSLFASSTFSQVESRRFNRSTERDQRFIEFAEDLDLTVEQKKELYEMSKEHRAELRKIGRGEDALTKRLALIEQYNSKMRGLLNEEQLQEYQMIKEKRKEKMTKRKKIREKLKIFRESNIEPFIKEQRSRFESLLSEEEKESLAKIRSELPNRENVKGKRRGDVKAKRNRLSEESRASLKAIMKEHEEEIREIHEVIKAQQEEWKEELKDLQPKEGRGRSMTGKMKKRANLRRGNIKYTRFLLMSPED